ncbi:MAG: zf-HC2 domain-containing protein [Nitriliruptorales bacterium]|nr:zf-HC2 domain-containing protein [Nitriliruptorales bacterium]
MRWPKARRSARRAPDCHEVQKTLQSFLDGELGPAEADVVADHLAHCVRCGIEARVFEDVKASLSQLRPDLDLETLARLQQFADELAGS